MNKENIKALINQLKGHAITSELETLLLHFESFIKLSEKNDGSEIQQDLEQAREQCFTSIEKVLNSFGFTPEMMQQHFENPSNFSAEEWQNVEEMKEEYLVPTKSNKRFKPQTGRI
ncbi:MAG TPA: hypothetical protein VLE96_05715 [Chlamydiales bacterium]|nr:hypothetical protein [Chlamydiales bacterium]